MCPIKPIPADPRTPLEIALERKKNEIECEQQLPKIGNEYIKNNQKKESTMKIDIGTLVIKPSLFDALQQIEGTTTGTSSSPQDCKSLSSIAAIAAAAIIPSSHLRNTVPQLNNTNSMSKQMQHHQQQQPEFSTLPQQTAFSSLPALTGSASIVTPLLMPSFTPSTQPMLMPTQSPHPLDLNINPITNNSSNYPNTNQKTQTPQQQQQQTSQDPFLCSSALKRSRNEKDDKHFSDFKKMHPESFEHFSVKSPKGQFVSPNSFSPNQSLSRSQLSSPEVTPLPKFVSCCNSETNITLPAPFYQQIQHQQILQTQLQPQSTQEQVSQPQSSKMSLSSILN